MRFLKPWLKRIMPTALRPRARHAVNRIRAAAHPADLTVLATLYGTDKWGAHWYAQHYQRHLARLRTKPIRLLEIGIGGEDTATGGASLRMWKHYFPKAQIAGIDLHDKSFVDQARIRTFRGDQADANFLRDVVAEFGTPDIIIDDGSHQNEHVIATFETLFPLLAADGIYAIEDLQTSYWPQFGGGPGKRTSMELLKALVDGLNYAEFMVADYEATFTDRHIVAIHFYHNLALIQKGNNDEGSNIL